MAVVSIDQLKAWFKTFAKPLESQFHDWIDSYRHKGDKITAADLEPTLLETINDLPDSSAIQQILQQLQQKATIEQFQDLQQQINDLSGVTLPVVLAVNADDSFVIPAGKLMHKIVAIAGNADAGFSVGYTNVTDELVEPTIIPAGTAAPFTCDHYKVTDYTIFFNGVTAPMTIKIYLL